MPQSFDACIIIGIGLSLNSIISLNEIKYL